jgi:nucleotide-binding universal stress UspA family protein
MKIKPARRTGGVVMELNRREKQFPADTRPQPKDSPFKIERILVPIDFSDCSRKALQYALPFAKQFGATIELIHVVPINYLFGSEFGAIDFPQMETELKTNAQKRLAEFVDREIGSGVPSEAVVRTGQPMHEIVAEAKHRGADLIILSTHGRTGLRHVFMGSVAENVIRYAPCPVLTVREREHEFVVA